MTLQDNPYPFTNLVDLLLTNIRSNRPDSHPAFIDGATDESISFGEYKKLIKQATAGFQRIGLGHGDCVSVYSPNDINVPITYMSVLATGGHVSPINAAFNVKELCRLLKLSNSKYLIAHPLNLDNAFEAARLAGIRAENVWCITKDPENRAKCWRDVLIREGEEANPAKFTVEESKNTIAYLCFSSGTTGLPKGVKISHYNFIANTIGTDDSYKESKIYENLGSVLATVPLFHILGISRFVHLSVYEGRTSVLMPRFDLETMCQLVQKHKVSVYHGVPPVLIQLINNPQIVDKYDLSSIEFFHVGGAPVSQALVEKIEKKFNAPVYLGYGMTELSSLLTVQSEENYMPGSVGRMLPCIQAKVTDEDGRDLPRGSIGEICASGPVVMMGYIGDPQATAQTIDKNGYLHTGDIGYEDELGNWFIVDRSKELIKYNAYQISPAELEDVLLKCPLVDDAAVIGVFDEKRQTEVPRAYIKLSPKGKAVQNATAEIHKFFNNNTTYYKHLRGGIEFVDTVPKSVSGKILRKDLREIYKQQQATRAKL